MELLTLAKDIHTKTWKSSQNNDLDMREFLRTDNALQAAHGK